MRVVATAGHVDHGKSSLVLALTGTDPDRFPEEKERGLTIDLGFAFCTLPSGQVVGFVDVPGHVRFVKNMLAGAGAVDVALLVVAANEGWMPQTEEHMQILDLLDVRHGMVALTKAALVDDETRELAQLEVAERTGWPVVVVDSVLARGLDDVRATLDAVLQNAPPPRDVGRPRLWVDRVFAAKGAGTVVTGTLTGGALARDEEVALEPGDRRARIRRIESHHEQLDRVTPGSRVALNLANVDHTHLERGLAVVTPGQWAVVDTVDVRLRVLPGRSLPRRATVHAHAGSGEQLARLRVLDDEGKFGRLILTTPLPLAPGDRLVLRSPGAQTTVAGAEVLDVAPARRTLDAAERLRLPLGARVLAARPWCTRAEMARLAGDEHAADGYAAAAGSWLVAPETLARVRARAGEMVEVGRAMLSTVAAACGIDAARLRAALAGDPALVIERDIVRDARQAGVLEDPAARKLLDALAASPHAPPAPADVGASLSLVRALVREGAIVELDGIVFATSALDDARERIGRLVVQRESISIADVRDLLRTSRKYILPIVNRMDAEGVTRRRGDLRIPGPRAQPS
ncbi:MAG: selenocysteine-specific elongation factor [Actinomycetota bacterium]|nr:selenocysteine-specific elongation factor [Actinomycetota bacterium]